jgi:nitrite reductase/ring-hydroxylating ferredoxin subunit
VSPETVGAAESPVRVELSDGGSAWLLVEQGVTVAYRNLCPHLDAPLDGCDDETWQPEARLLVCSFHGATFAARDGRCIDGPCLGSRLEQLDVNATEAGLELRTAPLLQLLQLTPRPGRP